MSSENKIESVDVPSSMFKLFKKQEPNIIDFFSNLVHDIKKGTNTIYGERYMYINANALTYQLRNSLEKMLGESGASIVLYNMGKALGSADCKKIAKTYRLTDPFDKLSAGPIYFNFAGWAYVKILPGSKLVRSEDYLLIYDHPNSFEVNKSANKKTCYINAGYSCGWCSEALDLPLVAREISCESKGDKSCRFIMAHRDKIMEHLKDTRIEEYLKI